MGALGILPKVMCLDWHMSPVLRRETGGWQWNGDIIPEMGPVAHSWLTRGPTGTRLSMGGTGFEPVTSWV